jgi:hypothetical protein
VKSVVFNTIILLSLLAVSFFMYFIPPIGSAIKQIKPIEMPQTHAYLQQMGNILYSREEMDKIYSELDSVETAWDKKDKMQRYSPSIRLGIILAQMQVIFVLIILLFSVFYRFGSYLDLIAIGSLLIFLTYVIPIFSVGTFQISISLFLFISIARSILSRYILKVE